MTIISRIVKAVVTLPILGTVSRNESGDVVKSGERYRIHIYAANPGWKDERPAPDFLVVGVLTGGGFTTEPTKRSQHVLVPEGRELVALMMDSDGAPLSFDSLPVELVALPDADDLFTINNGQVFIKQAVVGTGVTTHNVRMKIGVNTDNAATATDKIREIVSKYLYGQASEYEDELVAELKTLIEKESDHTRLATLISEQVRQRIKAESQPGGLLYGR